MNPDYDLDREASAREGAPETWRQRAARSIEDPFESMLAGLIAPTAAVGFAAAAMLGLAVIH
ncbi:MAG: hypothetical protein RIC56_23645 [Pseudomonadales bacterium]